MKKFILLFLIMLNSLHVIGQRVSLNDAGQVKDLSFRIGNIKIDGIPKTEPLADFFKQKIKTTLTKLKDTTTYYYYESLWDPIPTATVRSDLQKIYDWLNSEDRSSRKDTIIQLTSFFTELKALIEIKENDWFMINGNNFTETLKLADLPRDANSNSYIIELQVKNHLNQFLTNLFNDTYAAGENLLNKFDTDSYNIGETQKLKELSDKARSISKAVNDMTFADDKNYAVLSFKINNDPVIKSMKEASYYKNWIWLREAELTINPFELRGRDTTAITTPEFMPRDKAVNLADSFAMADKSLNRILLPAGNIKGVKTTHILLPEKDISWSDDQSLRGDEILRIYLHNSLQKESFYLNKVRDTAHSGLNETITGIGSALGSLAQVYKIFRGTSWQTLLLGNIDKNVSTDIVGVKDTIQKKDDVLSALRAAYIKKNSFNQAIFDSTKTLMDHNATIVAGDSVKKGYVEKFNSSYSLTYKTFEEDYNTFKADSVVITRGYATVFESNLPPKKMVLRKSTGPAIYKTAIIETKKIDKDVATEYQIKKITPNKPKPDTTVLTSFFVKSGKLKRWVVSTGLAFTNPTTEYGLNTFNEASTSGSPVTSTTKTFGWTVGLNVYIWKINMLSNRGFSSKDCPFRSRWSFYLGLDIPEVTKHFYPGIAYDFIPGLKGTVGAHLYRHTKYELSNNVAKTGETLKYAGLFFGVNIDPSVVINVINGLK